MIEIGRICIKIAGRDSNHKCVVVDIVDNNYVMIDGDVRRKKCNIKHLEPLDSVLKIKKGAAHATIVSEFKKLGIELKDKKSKPKTERPKKAKKKKKVAEEKKETKAKKPAAKKEEKPKKAAEKKK